MSRRLARVLTCAIPLGCIGVALCAALMGRAAVDAELGGATRGEAAPGEAGDEGLAGALRRAQELMEVPTRESSPTSFLADLASGSAAQGDNGSEGGDGDATDALHWVEQGDVPVVAEHVLRTYADTGEARLATSGYLDMRGNVWGAVVQGGADWCDVVLVSTEDERESAVRVTRLHAGVL